MCVLLFHFQVVIFFSMHSSNLVKIKVSSWLAWWCWSIGAAKSKSTYREFLWCEKEVIKWRIMRCTNTSQMRIHFPRLRHTNVTHGCTYALIFQTNQLPCVRVKIRADCSVQMNKCITFCWRYFIKEMDDSQFSIHSKYLTQTSDARRKNDKQHK